MPILYSVIARQTTVLAKFAECIGNFAEVTKAILVKMPHENQKLTYCYGNYLIHYIYENKIVYMCITDEEFERARAFCFLDDIKDNFIATYGLQVATAIAFAMNSEFSKVLAEKMAYYSRSDVEIISRVHGEINEVKNIIVKNIDTLKDRGEKLDLLVNKTENLRNNTVTFRNTSTNLARAMFWKNIKMYLIVGLIIIFILYVIISLSCGGLTWQGCINKK